MEMPQPDQQVIARKAALIAALCEVLPRDAVISDPMETRAYECDALTAYRCPPMLAVLPSSTEEVSAVLRICHAQGVPVVLGMNRIDGQRFFNAAVLMGGDGAVVDVYDKQHLVPFGESVPFGDLLARFGIHGMAARDGAEGGRAKVTAMAGTRPVVDILSASEIAEAFGRDHAVHAWIAAGGIADGFRADAARLAGFRTAEPAEEEG